MNAVSYEALGLVPWQGWSTTALPASSKHRREGGLRGAHQAGPGFQWVYMTSSPLSQRKEPVKLRSCRAVQKYSPSQL